MNKLRVKIVGVDCPTCVYAIRKNLSKVGGFKGLDVDVTTGEAIILLDDDAEVREVYRAIRDAGYDLLKESIEVYVDIEPEETRSLENKVLRLRGVLDVYISPTLGLMRISVNTLEVSREDLLKELDRFGVKIMKSGKAPHYGERYELLMRLVAFTLGLAVITYSTLSMFLTGVEASTYVLMPAATMVLLLSHSIIVRGYKSLLKRAPTMDSLISISSTISFLFGLTLVIGLIPHDLTYNHVEASSFFEASAGVLGFVSLGRYLEERLRRRALSRIDELEKAIGGKVRVVRDGVVEEVDVDKVLVNDVVEVKSGDKVPVDGVVIDGWGYVDESAFTGEPKPVLKRSDVRDYVLAGSILLSGYVRVRATRVGKDTVIMHIAESAREAQFYKPGFQRLADGVVGVLTWFVIALALTTSLVWYLISGNLSLALIFTASVLAVTCPCPLGIAIPMVVSVGVLVASKKGLLIRKGDVFERVTSANMVIFDKTGTLTIGKPRVRKVVVFNNDEKSLMSYVCSIESRSEHQLAKAILDYCSERGYDSNYEPTNYEHLPGLGIIGEVNGYNLAVGNAELMSRLGVGVGKEVLDLVDGVGNNGGTPILISFNGVLAGIIEVYDELREEAHEVAEFFKNVGFKVGIASGDVEANVKKVEEKLKADFSRAGLRPEDKADLINEMQSKGYKVVFVGDGVNDAIAISTSFIGVATSKATDIAKSVGDVVLISNDLRGLKHLLSLSGKVKRRALENLAWAFIYNGLLIPIAAGALYLNYGIILKPEWAALSMVLSDITVITNSLRLTAEGRTT
ncbi:MAG: cation-translocating P-type ATPase [Sulfolobales archaeon]